VSDAGLFFSMLGAAQDLTEFPVDLIELGRVPAHTASRIREKGMLANLRLQVDNVSL